MAGITFNPTQQSNAGGLFLPTSEGYVSGTALPAPNARNNLAAGFLDPAASANIWGGCGITDNIINPANEAPEAGSLLDLATAIGNLTGFTVFDQSTAMFTVPPPANFNGQAAPFQVPGGAINFYRFGSGARVVLPVTSAAVAQTLYGGSSKQQISWDYTNQCVIAYTNTGANAGALPVSIVDVQVANSKVAYVATISSGVLTWNPAGSVVVVVL